MSPSGSPATATTELSEKQAGSIKYQIAIAKLPFARRSTSSPSTAPDQPRSSTVVALVVPLGANVWIEHGRGVRVGQHAVEVVHGDGLANAVRSPHTPVLEDECRLGRSGVRLRMGAQRTPC